MILTSETLTKGGIRHPQLFQQMEWSEFQKRYLEFKGNQGKAQRTLDRYRASLDAFGRYLKKSRVEDVHFITL